MDFTIITPNYNGGTFLRDALASVAAQAGVTIDHWLIDGGSTDNSLEIAAEFPAVKVLSEPDKGMSEAINKGFDRATGEWVMWLNADDRLKPGALAAMKQFVGARPGIDLAYGAFDFIDGDGGFIRRMKLFGWSAFVSIHHCCYIPSTAAFLRRSTIIDRGYRLRADFHYVMDGEFYARLAAAGMSFGYCPLALAEFRLHEGNRSHLHDGKTRDMDTIVKAERQHVESRAIRRGFGVTLSADPYLNGLADGILYVLARGWKVIRKLVAGRVGVPNRSEASTIPNS